ncbi:MAG: TolC family protein [Bacillota bacterium]
MKKIIPFAAAICLAVLSRWSALGEEVRPLTLDEAVQFALKNDPAVVIARHGLSKAKLALKQEVWKVFPRAEVEGFYGYDPDSGKYPYDYTVAIKENIPTGLNFYGNKVVTGIEAAYWEQLNQEMQVKIAEARAICDVTALYLETLKAGNVNDLERKNLARAEETDRLAAEQLKVGRISGTDRLKTRNNLVEARLNYERSRKDYELALMRLGMQIGLGDQERIKPAAESHTEPSGLPPAKEMRDAILRDRLELKQAVFEIKKAERVLAQAKNEILPVLTIGMNRSIEKRDENESGTLEFGITYNFLTGEFSWYSSGNRKYPVPVTAEPDKGRLLKLTLTWTLDGGAGSGIKAAELDVASAKTRKEQKAADLILELEQARANYEMAEATTNAREEEIPYYEKETEAKRLEYRLGSASLADVSEAELNLAAAYTAALKAKYDQNIAWQKLQLALGKFYGFKVRASGR